MSQPHIPPVVAHILDWWLPEIQSCLGHRLRSVMLHGSVTLDDFMPRWSDVDVCVVLTTPITQGEAQVIGTIHDQMRHRFIDEGEGSWESGQAVEGCYIPADLAANVVLQMPCYSAGGSTRKWAVCHPVSPFDRYILAHFGHPVAGERVMFTPPSMQDLASQTEQDLGPLRTWSDDLEQSAIWMAGMLHWIARSLVFWREGTMLSKSGALRHEIQRGSAFASAFHLALEIREAGSATAASHYADLRRHFGQTARPAAREVERHMRGRSNA